MPTLKEAGILIFVGNSKWDKGDQISHLSLKHLRLPPAYLLA